LDAPASVAPLRTLVCLAGFMLVQGLITLAAAFVSIATTH